MQPLTRLPCWIIGFCTQMRFNLAESGRLTYPARNGGRLVVSTPVPCSIANLQSFLQDSMVTKMVNLEISGKADHNSASLWRSAAQPAR